MIRTSDAPGAPGGWTYSEYARLPDDGNRYEVVDGEVCVTPAPGPPHQEVAANLFLALRQYVEKHGLGKVFWDVDLLFVSGQFLKKPPRYRDFGVPEYWVVDRDARTMEVYRLAEGTEPEVRNEILRWQPSQEVPALEVAVEDLFSGV